VPEEDGVMIEIEDFIPQAKDLEQIPEENLSSEDRRNIAVNKAMKNEKESDPYDYSDIEKADDAYKEQLVKDALSEDEYKKIFDRDMNIKEESNDIKVEEEKDTENIEKDKPSNFQGATYISYFLKNRYKMKIPVPTYRCEASGGVTVNITVNQKGKVIAHKITEDSSLDECLRASAIRSVKTSRFNQNYDGPLKQRGTITYILPAQ